MIPEWFQMILRHLLTKILDVGKLNPKFLFKKLFILWKSIMSIQNKYSFSSNLEYSFKINFHFFKIQNSHSKKLFIFLKSRIFIQTKYSFFLKRAVSFRAMSMSTWADLVNTLLKFHQILLLLRNHQLIKIT